MHQRMCKMSGWAISNQIGNRTFSHFYYGLLRLHKVFHAIHMLRHLTIERL